MGVFAAHAHAQAGGGVTLPPLAQEAQPAPPGEAAVGLARALVTKTQSADITTMPGVGAAMGRFMQQWHITPHEHARIVFREALLPVLQKHEAAFAEIEARSYAADMSLDDLKAVNAFYDSPAGLALLHMREPLLKMNMAAIQQLLETLKPEIVIRTQEVMKRHGGSQTPPK